MEMGPQGPIGQACIDHMDNIRKIVSDRARRAGLRDITAFSGDWNILMKGSIVAAAEGDVQAARRARTMAAALIKAYRPQTK